MSKFITHTTEFPTVLVIAFLATLVLVGCTCYYIWRMKGLMLYMGILITLIGLLIILIVITDKTL